MPSQRSASRLNRRFLVRSLIVLLAAVALGAAGLALLPPPILANLLLALQDLRPADPLPGPPTIVAPRGALPAGQVGVTEQAQYQGGKFYAVGAGFWLRLDSGVVVGVTTAHSVDQLGSASRPLERIGFSMSDLSDVLVPFDTLYGPPGVPRSGNNMMVDYVLLKMPEPQPALDPALILEPDPRGAPQPGERVVLFSGRGGDGQGGPRVFKGTVQSVDDTGVWVVMDERFEAGGLSGSPLLSDYTGRIVGMTIAETYRSGHTVLGFHPIGSIVRHAMAAVDFPKIADFRR
jgi:hypothetical protein